MRKLIHLNFDIVLGAIINASVVGIYFQKEIRINELALLGIVVWIIYTLDRIIDIKKNSFNELSLRHQFHQKNQKSLIIAVCIALLFAGLLVLSLTTKTFVLGLFVSAMVILYFIFFKLYVKGSKEVLIGVIYTIGVFLPTLSFGFAFFLEFIIIFCIYCALALTNLLIISVLEFERDYLNKDMNFVQSFGRKKTLRILFVLTGLGLFLCLFTFYKYQSILAIIFLVMFFIYYLTIINREKIVVNEKYRLYMDSVLMMPGIFLLI